MDVLDGKWTTVVLGHLKQGPIRYSRLRRLVPRITEKMLSQRLRDLEDAGLIHRRLLSEAPPHVEYELTDTGRTLSPVLRALYDWGEEHAHREGFTIAPPGQLEPHP